MTIAFRIHLLLTAVCIVAAMVAALMPGRAVAQELIAPLPGVLIECNLGPCVKKERMITAKDAWQMKRDMGNDVLVVDIRGRAEAYYAGIPYGVDAQVPFMEPARDFAWNAVSQEPEMEFRTDFVANLDGVLRNLRMRHDDPVILMCRSGERAWVAAQLLEEVGYSRVYVVRDGFEGQLARSVDGSDLRTQGGWKNAGLPWTSRVHARWALSGPAEAR